MLNLSEYIPLAMRTMSPHSPTGKWEVDYMIHGLFGVMTELKEYKEATGHVNAAEEISDMFWFAAAMVKAVHLDNDSYGTVHERSPVKLIDLHIVEGYIQGNCCDMMDLVKRQLFYGPSVNFERWQVTEVKLQPLVKALMWSLFDLCYVNGFEPEKIMQLNIAKLNKRYADKFSDVAADCRDIQAEFEVMRNNLGDKP